MATCSSLGYIVEYSLIKNMATCSSLGYIVEIQFVTKRALCNNTVNLLADLKDEKIVLFLM